MSLLPYHSVSIEESRESLASLSRYPFLALPVYFHNGWAQSPHMFAREQLLDKLAQVQAQHLARRGLQWVVYDAWRPRVVQATIYQHYWRAMSQEQPQLSTSTLRELVSRYVAIPDNPAKTPPHSTGGAIDVGWWDRNAGTLVDLGSEFDEFCPRAASQHFEQPGQNPAIRNRRRDLRQWLEEAGLQGDADEWFHYDWGTQKWAYQAGEAVAIYGEVVSCESFNNSARVQYACDEPEASRTGRVQNLQTSLDLQHPAAVSAAKLPAIQQLVKQAHAVSDR